MGLLLVGYSALIGGAFGLAVKPLVAALLVLGGMALLACSAAELILENKDKKDKSDPGSDS